VVSTVAGVYAGSLIPAGAFGIDFALTAMFIALLVFQFRERLHVVTAVVAGCLSLACSLWFPGNGHIIIASLGAASLGLLAKIVRRRRVAP
jgi:predicted branched-subunit amino acid permease